MGGLDLTEFAEEIGIELVHLGLEGSPSGE